MGPELSISITAKDAASKVMQGVGDSASSMANHITNTSRSAGNAFTSLAGNAASIAAGLGVFELVRSGISAAGGAVIGFNNRMEQAQIGFSTMLGSGEKASAFLKDLQAFAAKTPFEFPELLGASQKLLAMGFSADQVVPVMTAVGDAVAGLGGGSFEVDRVTTALGQMRAKGKVSAEEMMQMTEAGIPVWDMLASKIGVTVPEAMKMAEKGLISSDKAIQAITQGMEERFGGMMAKQSQTFGGAMSTISDVLTQTTATAFKPFFDLISAGALTLAEMLQSDTFTAFGQSVADGISAAITALTPFAQVVQGIIETLFNLENTDALQVGLEAIFGADSPAVDAVMAFVVTVRNAMQVVWQVIQDSITTVTQVFQQDWMPSEEINIFTRVIGNLAIYVRDVVVPVIQTEIAIIVSVFEGMVTWVQTNWPLISEVVTNALRVVENVITTVTSTVQAIWSAHGATITTIATTVWNTIGTVVDAALQTVLRLINAALLLLQGDWQGAWSNVVAAVNVQFTAMQTIIGGALSAIAGAAVSGAVSIGRSLVEGIGNGISGLGAALQQLVSAAVRSINVSIGPFRLSADGFRILAPEMPNIRLPGFAQGGLVPGPAGSPLLAVVHGGETVVPAGMTLGAAQSGRSSIQLTINQYAPVYGMTDFEDALIRTLNRAADRGRIPLTTVGR